MSATSWQLTRPTSPSTGKLWGNYVSNEFRTLVSLGCSFKCCALENHSLQWVVYRLRFCVIHRVEIHFISCRPTSVASWVSPACDRLARRWRSVRSPKSRALGVSWGWLLHTIRTTRQYGNREHSRHQAWGHCRCLGRVLNIIPLAFLSGRCAFLMASPASPLYPATASRYLPASSLIVVGKWPTGATFICSRKINKLNVEFT